ncbi:MAG: glycerate kinase, partial [Clostridia bacterium]|nr:glycerate kinase [Clostridia bacterium]
MKKIAVVSDSFKGSVSSSEICAIVTAQAKRFFPGCEVVGLPVADGGEGTVDSFLECMTGEKVALEAAGPFFERRMAFYGRFGDTAIIEMAAAAGLPLVEDCKNPMLATTYGVGELMRHALEHGAVRLILALGGSATNDGGCGAAAALGTRFYDAAGEEFIPTGGTLCNIARIDNTACAHLLAGVEVIAMCDIDNPMHGERGAAYVFAPQKGADAEMVRLLDTGLVSLDQVITKELGVSVAAIPGAGAAGAMGAGAVAFFGAKLNPGIETVLDTVHFEERIAGADFVITGEGKLDSQSLRGKVVIGVARRAKKACVPVFAVVGDEPIMRATIIRCVGPARFHTEQ